jgi:hypothetical protein
MFMGSPRTVSLHAHAVSKTSAPPSKQASKQASKPASKQTTRNSRTPLWTAPSASRCPCTACTGRMRRYARPAPTAATSPPECPGCETRSVVPDPKHCCARVICGMWYGVTVVHCCRGGGTHLPTPPHPAYILTCIGIHRLGKLHAKRECCRGLRHLAGGRFARPCKPTRTDWQWWHRR